MKKMLLPFLFFAALSVNAQIDSAEVETDSIEIKYVGLPDSTGIGAPDGKPVSKEIGPSGGKIVSDDGRVELIFPEGALSINTAISIQPIVNLIPNGNGKAYQFEPSGIQFKKPVQIVFDYTDEEAETCPPELKFMAIQDHNGKWEYMDYDDWDSTARSLTGFISHFSVFGDGSEVKLAPGNTTLKVGDSRLFHLLTVKLPDKTKKESNEMEGDELPALPKPDVSLNKGQKGKWSVNFGTITPEKTKKIQASYIAPFMHKESIKVKLEIYITVKTEKTGRAGKKKGKMIDFKSEKVILGTFTSEVNLYDEYKITITEKGPSVLDCRAKLEDISDFTVKLYPDKLEFIGEPINRPPTLTKQADCKNKKYDPDGCQGPVDIQESQLEQYKISNDGIITIKFIPHLVKIMNNTGKFQNEKVPWEEGPAISSVKVINFKANRQPQNIKTGSIEFNILPD